jgi:acyl-CoA reductase-like NAD-dependent aldehyde dehydrogenase
LVEALAPVLAAGATAVVLVPHERPVAAAALAEVLATAELPAGAANVLTGRVGELATRLTGVDGLDLTGAPDDVAPDVVTAAAERGARVLAPPVIDDPPLSRLRAWSEVTTVWHPVGR